VSHRRSELPQTIDACHDLIRELYARIDELEAQVAQLRRELYGSRRERFINNDSSTDELTKSSTASDTTPRVADDSPQKPGGESLAFLAADLLPGTDEPPTSPRRRTSRGRQARSWDKHTPREKVYHRLKKSDVPAEIWNHPFARRFFRFVREEVELPQRELRIIEHYQEVIVVDNPLKIESTLAAASMPEPLLERCYVGTSLLAYLAVSRFAVTVASGAPRC
jgi:hypothetical protein